MKLLLCPLLLLICAAGGAHSVGLQHGGAVELQQFLAGRRLLASPTPATTTANTTDAAALSPLPLPSPASPLPAAPIPKAFIRPSPTPPAPSPSPMPNWDASTQQVALETTITAVSASSVSVAVLTSVVVSMTVGTAAATAAGGAALGGLAASLGGVATSMVMHVQQWALLGGVSADLGRHYAGVACGLQWANFQVRLLGSDDKPACRWPVYALPSPSPDPITTSIDSLLGNGSPVHRRSLAHTLLPFLLPLQTSHTALLEDVDTDMANARHAAGSLGHGWAAGRVLLAVPVDEAGRDTLVLQAYERLLVMAIILGVLLGLHQLVCWYWHFLLRERSISRLFAFPHPELLFLTVCVIPVSEAAGILLSSRRLVPTIIGALLLLLLLAYLAAVYAVCAFVYAHRFLVQDELFVAPRALSQRLMTSLRQRLHSARQRLEATISMRRQGPPLDDLQRRELAYRKARDLLHKEEREEAKRSWLEPTRTDGYVETGINLLAVFRLLRVHAPVVFGAREAQPGDRMWRAVESVRERREAELESLVRHQTEELPAEMWDGLRTEKFKAMEEHQAVSAYVDHQQRRAAWALGEAHEEAAAATAAAEAAESAAAADAFGETRRPVFDNKPALQQWARRHVGVPGSVPFDAGQQAGLLHLQTEEPACSCSHRPGWQHLQQPPAEGSQPQSQQQASTSHRRAPHSVWWVPSYHSNRVAAAPVAEGLTDGGLMDKLRPSVKKRVSMANVDIHDEPQAGGSRASAQPPAASSAASLRSSGGTGGTGNFLTSLFASFKGKRRSSGFTGEDVAARGSRPSEGGEGAQRRSDARSSQEQQLVGRERSILKGGRSKVVRMSMEGEPQGSERPTTAAKEGEQRDSNGEEGPRGSKGGKQPYSKDNDKNVRRGARFHADVDELEEAKEKQREEAAAARALAVQQSGRSFQSQVSHGSARSVKSGYSMAFTAARTDCRTLASQMSRASSRSTLAVLKATGADAASTRAAASAEVERQKQLIHCELRERLGALYKDHQLETWPATFFHFLLLCRCVLQGLLVGIQQGAGIAYGSSQATGINALLYLLALALCGLVLFVRPHRNPAVNAVMVAGGLCEAGLAFCILFLCFQQGTPAAQQLCFALQLVVVAGYVCLTWVASGALAMELVHKVRHDRDRAARKLELAKEEAAIWEIKFERAQAERHAEEGQQLAEKKQLQGQAVDQACPASETIKTGDDTDLLKQLLTAKAGTGSSAGLSLAQVMQAAEQEGRALREQLCTGVLSLDALSMYLSTGGILGGAAGAAGGGSAGQPAQAAPLEATAGSAHPSVETLGSISQTDSTHSQQGGGPASTQPGLQPVELAPAGLLAGEPSTDVLVLDAPAPLPGSAGPAASPGPAGLAGHPAWATLQVADEAPVQAAHGDLAHAAEPALHSSRTPGNATAMATDDSSMVAEGQGVQPASAPQPAAAKAGAMSLYAQLLASKQGGAAAPPPGASQIVSSASITGPAPAAVATGGGRSGMLRSGRGRGRGGRS